MRIVRYSEVLRKVAGLMGFSLEDLTEQEFFIWATAINDATRYFWEYHDWPELALLAELDTSGQFYDQESGFVATMGGAVGLAFAQLPGKPLGIFKRDPRGENNPGRFALEYRKWSGGTNFNTGGVVLTPEERPEKVWLWLKRPYLDYRGVLFTSENVGKRLGDTVDMMEIPLVYARRSDGIGEGFSREGDWGRTQVILQEPAANPFTAPTNEGGIIVFPYPYLASDYAAKAAAAQLLEVEGKAQLARHWRAEAERVMESELERALDETVDFGRFGVGTR